MSILLGTPAIANAAYVYDRWIDFVLSVDHCFVSVISAIIIKHHAHRLFSDRVCFASCLTNVTKEITLNWPNDFQAFVIESMRNIMTNTIKDIVWILFKRREMHAARCIFRRLSWQWICITMLFNRSSRRSRRAIFGTIVYWSL